MRIFSYLLYSPLLLLWMSVGGVLAKTSEEETGTGFEEFAPQYNQYIKKWLSQEYALKVEERAQLLKESSAQDSQKEEGASKVNEDELADLNRAVERLQFRLELGDYFAHFEASDLPKDLIWENGMDQPLIGDPRSKKGGVYRTFMTSFPPTLRPFGPNSNHSFRGDLYDKLGVSLIGVHPKTKALIPGLATEWALSKDGRTIFYRLDPDAAYNDGVKVKARDFQVAAYLRVSDHVLAPFAKQYYREQLAQIATYGEDVVAVSLPEPKPHGALDGSLSPAPSHFYQEYGPDYEQRYQWKVPPTTGAYYVKPEDIKKGVSITLTRAKDWWAKDKRYYQYAYNVDKVRYTVIRDENKAWELFRLGELDAFGLTRPNYWYEKSEIREVFKGYIERYCFYNQYPRIPRGLYLNLAEEVLKDLNTRQGIGFAMNWQKVIDVIYQGDYSRLQSFAQGYGKYTLSGLSASPYSIQEARQSFAKAGYVNEGGDGILIQENGKRLEVAVSYRSLDPTAVATMTILKEEAKKAGLDLILDGQENSVFFGKVVKKEHQMAFLGWGVGSISPSFYQFFYGKNAYDEKGNRKANTNNINSYSDPKMDVLCKAHRNARTQEELREVGLKIQKIIHDEAIFIPSYANEFVRIGCWRWMRWPDTEETRFCAPHYYSPLDSYLFWIDEEVKQDTLSAKRVGKAFPEVQKVIEEYRLKKITPTKQTDHE